MADEVDHGAFDLVSVLGTEAYKSGDLEAAETCWRQALDMQPGNAALRQNLAVLLARQGRAADAIAEFDILLKDAPGNARAHANRAGALVELGDFEGALAGYDAAIAAEPDFLPAAIAKGDALFRAGRFDEADDVLTAVLDQDAENYPALAGRALARVALGDHLGACVDFDRTRDLRGVAASPVTAPPVELAVNPVADSAAMAAEWQGTGKRVAVIDDFLNEEALGGLRDYLEDDSSWAGDSHIDGFMATYFETGLASPLTLQIVEETREAFPELLEDLPLIQGWAFRGTDPRGRIGMHADDAAISVNFWVTPDGANLDPDHGGLIVHRALPPADWAVTGYDEDKEKIEGWIAENETDPLEIPYRANRAVLFDSRLFHGSAPVQFKPGTGNQRINITLLFGYPQK